MVGTDPISDLNITNSGTINASGMGIGTDKVRGINIDGNLTNSSIINQGTISAYSNNAEADGIYVHGDSHATISNAGAITVNSTNYASSGIYIKGNNDGNISNSGVISVSTPTDTAVGIQTYSNSGTIANLTDGNITVSSQGDADVVGIAVGNYNVNSNISNNSMNTGTIINSGVINVSSTLGTVVGIFASYNATTGNITNAVGGTITATSPDGMAAGIANYENSGNILNAGTMIVDSNASSGGSYGAANGIINILNAGKIENSGTITVTSNNTAMGMMSMLNGVGAAINSKYISGGSGPFSLSIINGEDALPANFINSSTLNVHTNNNAVGMLVKYNAQDSNVTNSGTISVHSTSSNINSTYATGIATWFNVGNITNSGTINVDANNSIHEYANNSKATGIYTEYNARYNTSIGTITNSGTITVTSTTGSAYGIDARQNGGIITNNGSITADGNSAAYGIYIGEDGGGSVDNNGTIRATINGQLDAQAYSIYSNDFDDGVVLNGTNGVLQGNIHADSLTNHGIIALPYNANGDNAAYIQNFTNASDGTLQIAIKSTDGTTAGNYSQLKTQNATFADNSHLYVNVLNGTNEPLLQGKTFLDVVTATDNLDVNISKLIVGTNSVLLSFTATDDRNASAIDLTTVKAATIYDTTVAGLGNSNARGAATSLDTISDNLGTHTAMQNYISALNGLTTQGQVAHAVESTTGEVTTASTGANVHLTNSMQNIVEMRQRQMSGVSSGLNGGDEVYGDKQVWIKPFISFGTQQDKNGQSGFDVNTHGFGLGYDDEFMSNNRIGLALFYSTSNVNLNNVSQTNNMNNWTALLYGSTPLRTLGKNTQFLYQLGYSTQTNKTSREIYPTYQTATADYTSTAVSADVKLMGGYQLNKELTLRPIAEFNYRHFMNPSYNESGAGAMNLQVKDSTLDQSILNVGTILEYQVDRVGKFIADLRAGYNFNHEQAAVTSNYEGATDVNFQTKGIDNGGFVYDAGIGYELSGKRSSVDFMYNTQGEGSTFNNNIFSAKYVYKF